MLLEPRHIQFPCSDGEPTTDRDVNRRLMEYAEWAIATHLRDQPDVYVSANLFIYYDEQQPSQKVAPDVFVVKGVPRGDRDVFICWEEGRVPVVVFEFVSPSSRTRDPGPKLGTYAAIGVEEYYIFDAAGGYLDPPFQAYRLVGGNYVLLEVARQVTSPALGLDIQVQGKELRFLDPATGKAYPTPEEAYLKAERADREAERAQFEAERAACLEQELARLKRLLEAQPDQDGC